MRPGGWLAATVAIAAGSIAAAVASSACRPAAPAALAGPTATALPAGRLPARLRRLSNAEYARTLSELVGFAVTLPDSFPEDVRERGFSANARQGVDASYLAEAQQLARGLAQRALGERLAQLVPCDPGAAECERSFVAQFSERAYRRPARAEELEAALQLFRAARAQGSFASAAELLVATLLVSPQLLYVSEIGEPVGPGLRRLSSEELASVLSYLLTGGPPDAELQAAGREGRLDSGTERERQAWRLLAQSDTRFQFRRFVREWLGLDVLAQLTKPVADDRRLREGLLAETDAFVDEVLMYEGASLDKLLLANFTVIPASLRAFEGLAPAADGSPYGRVSLAGSARLGLLQQPSFLAVNAHESESAPVLRGKAVLERLLCVKLPRPTELGIVVTFPPSDPARTTRQRHLQHSADPTCRSCHRTIDALGDPFENFDFVGRARSEENQIPVDTRSDYEGPGGPQHFRDSTDVSRWLAQNPTAHECFARQAYRFFSGDGAGDAEAAFLAVRAQLPEARQRDLFQTLVAFIASPAFVERGEPGPGSGAEARR